MTPLFDPKPPVLPLMRPGLYERAVPVDDNSMILPFVTASSRRRKDTSCDAKPGCVGDVERIFDIRIGLPVRVESVSLSVKYLTPVKCSDWLWSPRISSAWKGLIYLEYRIIY